MLVALRYQLKPNLIAVPVVLAWNYRRHVLAQMPVRRSELSELVYTKRKIESNISNFSAWHQRSKVLTSLWDAGKLDKAKTIEEGKCHARAMLDSSSMTWQSSTSSEMRCTQTPTTRVCGSITVGLWGQVSILNW